MKRLRVVIALTGSLVLASLLGGPASAARPGGPAPAALAAAAGHTVKGANLEGTVMTKEARHAASAAAGNVQAGSGAMFDHHGVSASEYGRIKSGAASATGAPRQTTAGAQAAQSAPVQVTGQTATPGASTAFLGMSNSAATCPYFGGCQPSDMSVAASDTFVVQVVNTSIAAYDTVGTLQPGFPSNLQTFFGAPDPAPAGCDANGPFFSDPRAFYDYNDQRFWVLGMQVEGRAGLNGACSRLSLYWVAVTQTADPTGVWNVYAFDMALGGPNWADYPGFGMDAQAIYFTGNLFPFAGGRFQAEEVFAANKSNMEQGLGTGYAGFIGQSVGGILTDTLQPVVTLAGGFGPQTEFLVQSFNINFGGGQCRSACSGVVLWAFSNPLFQQGGGQSLTGVVLGTNSYSLPPLAPNPGGGGVDTLDTRISGTPTYQNGRIWFSLNTNVNNGSQNTPGILWTELQGSLNDGAGACTLCTTIRGGGDGSRLVQQGYFFYGGNGAAWYGTLAPDSEGNMFMIFNFSGLGFNPSSAYVSRRVTDRLGAMHDGGIFLVASTHTTFDTRWGDYSAASFTGPANNTVWVAAEHSCTDTGDWCTALGALQYSITST